MSDSDSILASPVARRMAAERGIDLAAIEGSGPRGRIVRGDVEAIAAAPAAGTAAAPSADAERIQPTRVQQLIARRMIEAKATVPEFELCSEVDMGACLALRERRKAAAEAVVPSVNDIVVRACALALREQPRVNSAYVEEQFELRHRVNVGIAVASSDALVVPTIFDADRLSLAEIAAESRRLAERVRAGTIMPAELGEGTFTVSNLGMFGIESFTAVINPPQAAILAVGATVERLRPRHGKAEVCSVMGLTLTCDHRILYGADGARFLTRVKALLEDPEGLDPT